MSEPLALLWAVGIGLVLGGIFFGGLWWTVRRGVSSQRPALLFFSSMLLRTSIVVAGFYFVGRAHWQPLLMCLLGFLVARLLVTRLTRAPLERPSRPAAESRHAP